jgi:hypothetical protein
MTDLTDLVKEPGVSCSITILPAATPCAKCEAIASQTYTQDCIYGNLLADPVYGPIWDLDADASLIHPNCQCVLVVTQVLVDTGVWVAVNS